LNSHKSTDTRISYINRGLILGYGQRDDSAHRTLFSLELNRVGMMLVRNQPLLFFLAQPNGYPDPGVEDLHNGVTIRHRFVGDDSQFGDVE
jgi:hypothetical protein